MLFKANKKMDTTGKRRFFTNLFTVGIILLYLYSMNHFEK